MGNRQRRIVRGLVALGAALAQPEPGGGVADWSSSPAATAARRWRPSRESTCAQFWPTTSACG